MDGRSSTYFAGSIFTDARNQAIMCTHIHANFVGLFLQLVKTMKIGPLTNFPLYSIITITVVHNMILYVIILINIMMC